MDEVIQPQMGLNFEQVWAALMETRRHIEDTDRLIKESQQKTDKQMQETDRLIKETDKQVKETDKQMKETDRQVKELNKKWGDMSNRFGELAEHLVIPNIVEKFNALGYHFEDTAKERKFSNPETKKVDAEFDALLENGKYSIGVEVKAKPNEEDVSDHINRLEFLRRYKDKRGDKREIRGAIAGAIMPDHVRRAALKAGMYVIEQSGDTVKIEEPPKIRGW
jgi:hypothetical protein